MKKALILILAALFGNLAAQQEVSFLSTDSITIFADRYHVNDSFPYVLLFHQQDASRGEFNETAPKIIKMGYNALVVDLRYGDEINYKPNMTAFTARRNGSYARMKDIELDIMASIQYLESIGVSEMILAGSTFSGTMSLKLGKNNPAIKGIIAFSPGEYFMPHFRLEEVTNEYNKPVLVTCTQSEKPYVEELIKNIPADFITLFSPDYGDGVPGSKALWENNPTHQEYWLAMLIYFRNLKAIQAD
jgi:dienelactone hydrolase